MPKATQIEAIGSYVIVVPDSEETKSKGGLIIPHDDTKPAPDKGVIVSIGPGSGNQDMPKLKVGDHVIYKRYSTDEVKMDGKTYCILAAFDIMAIIN